MKSIQCPRTRSAPRCLEGKKNMGDMLLLSCSVENQCYAIPSDIVSLAEWARRVLVSFSSPSQLLPPSPYPHIMDTVRIQACEVYIFTSVRSTFSPQWGLHFHLGEVYIFTSASPSGVMKGSQAPMAHSKTQKASHRTCNQVEPRNSANQWSARTHTQGGIRCPFVNGIDPGLEDLARSGRSIHRPQLLPGSRSCPGEPQCQPYRF